MTGKERLNAALKCKPVDRVPVSCYQLDTANLSMIHTEHRLFSYKGLLNYIGDNCDLFMPVVIEYIDSFISKNENIEAKRKADGLFLSITWKTPKGDISQKKRLDLNLNNQWTLEPFIKNENDLEKMASIVHSSEKLNINSLLEKEAAVGDKGILLASFADPLGTIADYFEYGDFLTRLASDLDSLRPLLDPMHEVCLKTVKEFIKHMKGKNVAVRLLGPKMVAPPNASPEIFHEVICRYDKIYIDLLKEAGIPVRIHCQGKIKRIADHLLELGAEAIDPAEPLPQGDLTLRETKELFKGRMCVCGGIEASKLENGTMEEIDSAVRECMEQAKEGYGYIILPSGSPLEVNLTQKLEDNYRTFIDWQ